MNVTFPGAAVPASLRQANLTTIFDLIRLEGTLSRAEIVRRTGISHPTVSSATRLLAEKQIIREIGEGHGHLGRRPVLLGFNPDAAFTIGIDLGGNSVDVGLVDLAGRVRTHVSHPCGGDVISREDLSLIPRLVEAVLGSDAPDIPRGRILGVGVGVPGATDPLSGAVQLAPQLGGRSLEQEWVSLKQALQRQLPLPLSVENDVNAAALGEQQARGKDSPPGFVFVSVGAGIGAGLIFERRLYRGSHNAAGEVGYMVVDDKSRWRRHDEFGGLERVASCPALVSRARALGWSPVPPAADGLDECMRRLGLDATRGIEPAGQALDEGADYLSLALANILSVYDPALVVIGGVILEAGPWFVQRLADKLNRACPFPVPVEASRNGSLAGLVGAATVAFRNGQHALLAGGEAR